MDQKLDKKKSARLARIILRIGYLLAVPALFPVIESLRKKNVAWPGFPISLAEFLGAAFITTGWIMRNKKLAAFINGSWFLVFTIFWLRNAGSKNKE